MKIDERLKTLCEEFANLEEAEKDYILGVSQVLAHSVSVKDGNTHKGGMPLSGAGINQTENERNIQVVL